MNVNVKIGQLWQDPWDGELLFILGFHQDIHGALRINGWSYWPGRDLDMDDEITQFARLATNFENAYKLVSDVYEP